MSDRPSPADNPHDEIVRPLRCPTCDACFRDRWRCTCGAPLEFDSPPIPSRSTPSSPASVDTRAGLWAFNDFIAVGSKHARSAGETSVGGSNVTGGSNVMGTSAGARVSLGEGMTPLVDAPEWDASFKLEYVFPTGSFKDRGATTTMTRARSLGVSRVVEDSSGNAGAAIATYSARAGIDAEIYVPASVKESKLKAIERAGATIVRVDGSRADVTAACLDAVTSGDAWYASHAWNPAFFEGTATVAYEIAFQRDWDVPDAVVCPVGHGTLLLGAYWGFRRLHRAGWIDSLPRLLGAQAAGMAPIVERIRESGAHIDTLSARTNGTPSARITDGTAGDNTAADGIRIADPVRIEEITEAIRATDGDVITVSEAALKRETDHLHRAGFYTEPTSAVAPAALRTYRARGVLNSTDEVVVPLTGSGLKR